MMDSLMSEVEQIKQEFIKNLFKSENILNEAFKDNDYSNTDFLWILDGKPKMSTSNTIYHLHKEGYFTQDEAKQLLEHLWDV
ncbi:hypothetical protein PP175_27090 (plasmid) [Aneurinibacillus sp. Ricciae_BoGa-3]|uniref:hypothetical protein n=1 Tax=Aneurinibacillus sp. Ricciae_BoGa-3 TaxID=3022697 RepID=UPI0023404F60|nr:hypothetical protein [Aneurinibacillus sp. Ricciae_BoGa-3]WCK57705.1 hypothetical protein PP175_27090 [Aneurinibacillus sp. Ricciae_BoGa-3]